MRVEAAHRRGEIGRDGRPRPRRPPRAKSVAAAALAAAIAAAMPAAAPASPSDSTAVAIPGSPLTVYVGPRGECQSSYVVNGQVEGNFFPGGDPYTFNQVADCGFFLAFPKGASQPAGVKERTFGFQGNAGPLGLSEYAPVAQSGVSGAGTASSPLLQTTTFDVVEPEKPEKTVAEITETTSYVDGQPQFASTYDVKNVSGKPLLFRALYAGDLFVNGSDVGSGVFLGGPPRFIGGQNTSTGVFGGFIEAAAPSPPWSSFQELDFPSVWTAIETAAEPEHEAKAFTGGVEPAAVDNAAGVEWDEYMKHPLADGADQAFSIINRTQVPTSLQVSPASQTLTQGQGAAVTVSALDTAGQPYAGKTLRYTIAGANPSSGAVALNAAGQAQIADAGVNAGLDTIQMYLDLPSSGKQVPNDPAGAATVTFLPRPALPDSGYTVRSARADPNGTITIVFVPAQAGEATLAVTVPTATIARTRARAARHPKRCGRGRRLIKRSCRPAVTLSGRVRAPGAAGVPLALTVKPSRSVTAALRRHRRVHLTARLAYQSGLGGAPSAESFVFSVRLPARHRTHRKH